MDGARTRHLTDDMTTKTPKSGDTRLVNQIQGPLYRTETADLAPEGSGDLKEGAPCGWWAFQYDPRDPTGLTVRVAIAPDPADDDTASVDGQESISQLHGRMNASELGALQEWLEGIAKLLRSER